MAISVQNNRRLELDIIKLLAENYEVRVSDNLKDIFVGFYGPLDTVYAEGAWIIRLHIPERYPFEGPFISFINKIFHPNICEQEGSTCLNALCDSNWTPICSLSTIFDSFLPQLLKNPDHETVLNPRASSLLKTNPEEFEREVAKYIYFYAKTDKKSLHCKEEDNESTTSDLSEDEIED